MPVYLAVSEKLGIAKLGYSATDKGVKKRLRAFRTVAPDMKRREIFDEGTTADERAIHKFLRRRGDWIGGEVYHWHEGVLVAFQEHVKRVRANPNRYKQYGLDLWTHEPLDDGPDEAAMTVS
jgi:hypothetical protein